MGEKIVGVFGATGLVGQCLLPLLLKNGWSIRAFSRRHMRNENPQIKWIHIQNVVDAFNDAAKENEKIHFWICVASIWILPDYFPMLEQYGARRVIAVSSTSLLTKSDSRDSREKTTALKLSNAENRLHVWAKNTGTDWVILRPTLIYGLGQDKNISQIAHLIQRFGFFPLLGHAEGLRQPVHAEDVAEACLAALENPDVVEHVYNLSGGETLTYREMISRVFAALGRRPRLINVPLWIFRFVVTLIRLFPRDQHWTMQMAERMNADLVFDHTAAVRDLNYSPRKFQLDAKDLPT